MHEKKGWHFGGVQEEHISKGAALMTKSTCMQQVLTAYSASRSDIRAFGWCELASLNSYHWLYRAVINVQDYFWKRSWLCIAA